ncbi:MAG: lipoyl synthase [Bacteroidales bacterium]
MKKPVEPYLKKPEWLRIHLPRADHYQKVKQSMDGDALHTICESGACPNKGECWGSGTATFMILGDICTRSCRFCNVKTGKPLPPDPSEPMRVARAVQAMKVKHCVITSVDRDDLPDGGAAHWADTINSIRQLAPGVTLETLIPDFKGNIKDLDIVMHTRPQVVSHNLETVERLSREVRVYANYRQSLQVIAHVAAAGIRTKSGIMLGLGETEEEIFQAMDDLLEAGCQVLTLGQYLQPTRKHLNVKKYVHPDDFERYGRTAREKGFLFVESAPLVRSSFHAEKHV